MIQINQDPLSIFSSPFLISEKFAIIIFIIFCIDLILILFTQSGLIFQSRPALAKWLLGILLIACGLFFSGPYGFR